MLDERGPKSRLLKITDESLYLRAAGFLRAAGLLGAAAATGLIPGCLQAADATAAGDGERG
jgi:hypothetical protein